MGRKKKVPKPVEKHISKTKIKKVRLCYKREHVALALRDVSEGKSIAETARLYNIPESTIRAKKKRPFANKTSGPPTVLSSEEEQELVDWIFDCCKKGFPITKSNLFDSVKQICEKLQKQNPFTNNTPGRYWYSGFLKRHPEVSERISENVCLNRAKVSELSLRNWFQEIFLYLEAENLLDISPDRIFNSDETGTYTVIHNKNV